MCAFSYEVDITDLFHLIFEYKNIESHIEGENNVKVSLMNQLIMHNLAVESTTGT